MSEQSNLQTENKLESLVDVGLRTATSEDCELMFRLQHLGGGPFILDSALIEAKWKTYQEEFDPSKVSVIEKGTESVGRLRVVRDSWEIYIGGIQVLPEYRGQGIGSKVLLSLIEESENTQTPIKLEVFHDNERAQALYRSLGFVVVDQTHQQLIMRYNPSNNE